MKNTSIIESPKIKKVFSFKDMVFLNEEPKTQEEQKTNVESINPKSNNYISPINNTQMFDNDIRNPNNKKGEFNQIYTSPNKRKYLKQFIETPQKKDQNIKELCMSFNID